MIKRIKEKVKKVGGKQTIHLIYQKVRSRIDVNINYIFCWERKNGMIDEQYGYWKNYKYIERKYKKKLINMPKITGTNKFSNKIWWLWLQGEENAPEMNKKCLESLKKYNPDKEIIVISEKNLYDYIEFPDYIKNKYKKGIISNAHFSDLIRLQLLIKYGGTWIDSTTFCSGVPDEEIFKQPLFVYLHNYPIWFELENKSKNDGIVADNWFISSEISNPILVATRDLMFDYWKCHNYISNYFLWHYMFTLVVTYKYSDLFKKVLPVSCIPPHYVNYEMLNKFDEKRYREIKKMTNFHKLTYKIPKEDIKEDSYYNYILNYEFNN